MGKPLVTTIDDPDAGRPGQPTVLIIFNDRSGPGQVAEIIATRHSFTETEVWETDDEQGRAAWLLAITCETASAETLFELIGSRLPDYIQARRFPLGRLAYVRDTGVRID